MTVSGTAVSVEACCEPGSEQALIPSTSAPSTNPARRLLNRLNDILISPIIGLGIALFFSLKIRVLLGPTA